MNPYEELDVPKGADAEAIRRAYKRKAQKAHPDKGGDPATFQRLNKAYLLLTDESKRRHYDAYGTEMLEQSPIRMEAIQNFSLIFSGCLDTSEPETKDLVRNLKVYVENLFPKFQTEREGCLKKIKKRESVLRRLKKQGAGEDILAQLLRADIRKQESQLAEADRQIEIGKEMQKILSEYTYTVDAPSQGFGGQIIFRQA